MATYRVSGGGSALSDRYHKCSRGDVIYVAPGVYDPVIHRENDSATRFGVIIIGESPDTCIIDGGGVKPCALFPSNWGYADRVKFYNFTFRNGSPDWRTLNLTNWSNPGWYDGAPVYSVILVNCKITEQNVTYVYGEDASTGDATKICNSCVVGYCNMYGCEVFGNTTNSGDLIGTCTTVHCNIHDNTLLIANPTVGSPPNYEGAYLIDGNNKHHNVIHHNRSNRMVMQCCSSAYNNQCNLIAFNNLSGAHSLIYRGWCNEQNTYYGNTGTTYLCNHNGSHNSPRMINVVEFNNTLASSDTTYPAYPHYSDQTYWCKYCCFDAKRPLWSTNASYTPPSTLDVTGTFRTSVDPGFVDPENMDFRLRSDSILIARGTHDGLYGTLLSDLAKNRFKSPRAIGAYEWYDLENPGYSPPTLYYPMGVSQKQFVESSAGG